MVLKIQIELFWVHTEDGGSMFLHNAVIHLSRCEM
jgi:hypothetical protein